MQDPRIAFDRTVLRRFLKANSGSAVVDAEALAAVRIVFYLGNPYIPPSVAKEVDANGTPEEVTWTNFHFEEISRTEFYDGCVAQTAREYLNSHPDPGDCHLVAEVECAHLNVLLTLKRDLIERLGPKAQKIKVLTPSDYWKHAKVAPGAPPQTEPAEGHPLRDQDWWRW